MHTQKQFYNNQKTAYRSTVTQKKGPQKLSQETDFTSLKRQRQEKMRQKKIKTIKRRIEFVVITIIVFLLAIVVGVAGYRKKQKNDIYLERIAELEKQIEKEEQRKEDLVEYGKYVQTDRYIEEIARERLGLVMPDEVIFKPQKD